ncbi:MAG: hypothetical protein KAJ19_00495 [Gammaproteobacteria bacterium]|nr:hypothetical protein [Gammaproteobacteria bacterium]
MIVKDKDGNMHLGCNICGETMDDILTEETIEQLKKIDPDHWDGYMCDKCKYDFFAC